jgi:hypothetical protein
LRFPRSPLGAAARRIELAEDEEDARRVVAYEKAKSRRHQIARELSEYPVIVEKLAKLLSALTASNHEIAVINRALPDGAAWIQQAEMLAKGQQAGDPLDRGDVSVLEARLPPWRPHLAPRWPADPRFIK